MSIEIILKYLGWLPEEREDRERTVSYFKITSESQLNREQILEF